MTESQLMVILGLLACCGVAGYVARLRRRGDLPATTFEGFRSPGKVWRHFRVAISLLVEKKWLLYLPVGLVLVDFLVFAVPPWWRRRCELAATGELSHFLSLPGEPIDLRVCVNTALRTPRALLNGYVGALRLSVPVIVLCAIVFLMRIRRLRHRTSDENLWRLALVATTLWTVLICLVPVGIVYFFAPHTLTLLPHDAARVWLCVEAAVMWLLSLVLTVTNLFPLALLEGWLLLYFAALVRGHRPQFGDLWNGSLSVLMPLVRLSLFWFVILDLPRDLWNLVDIVLGLADAGSGWFSAIQWEFTSWWRYLEIVVALLFCCAAFFVVVNRMGAARALRANLALIGRHSLKWVIFVGLCVFCLALSSVGGLIVRSSYCHLEWLYLVLEPLTRVVNALFRATCSLALFSFFLQYGAERSDGPVEASGG